MPRRRVTPLDHDEALAVCERIKAKYPNILERRQDGHYRYLVSGEVPRQALFDYLACDRVVAAWARKKPAKVKDLERMRRAEGKY